MRAVEIEWDTDGDESVLASLPKEKEIPDDLTDPDDVTDWLSDQTGFCIFGYRIVKSVFGD